MAHRLNENKRGLIGVLLVAALATVAACSDDPSSTVSTEAVDAPETTEATLEIDVSLDVLPEREGPRRQTTGAVPHIQTDAEPFPDVDMELRRRAFSIPGVEDRPSAVSLPGARGLSLADDVPVVQDGVLPTAREFAHFHPDGSLHIWLPVERAQEVDETKWGEIHPWADREGFWEGTVMVYVPESAEEAEVALRLIIDAYNFISGASLTTADVP